VEEYAAMSRLGGWSQRLQFESQPKSGQSLRLSKIGVCHLVKKISVGEHYVCVTMAFIEET
jgi:hypothetical protein